MKSLLTTTILLSALLLAGCGSAPKVTGVGLWNITVDDDGRVDIIKGDEVLFRSVGSSFSSDGEQIDLSDYSRHKMRTEALSDDFGTGTLVTIAYTAAELPTLRRNIYLYEGLDYVVTDIEISGKGEVSAESLSPVEIPDIAIGAQDDSRRLFIPFDNDKWIRYSSEPLEGGAMKSYEVAAMFDNNSRRGVIVGSIDHTTWKTAIESVPLGNGNVALRAIAGVADTLTRDSKPHGIVRGEKVTSPKMLLGVFDDWRDGLETYANANTVVAPEKEWTGAVPFGWNSWGVLQFGLTPEKSLEVSDYFKDNLQHNSFVNPDNAIVIGLDSGWSEWPEEEIKAFADRCKANGQQAGIYWTPFTDWGKRGDRNINHAEEYTYADAWLPANGKPQDLDGAYAMDPTHPAVEAQMKYFSELFRRNGFSYVKMDFMTHGALEADKWYRPEIQTGMQAYNYGMALLDKYFGDMYINLSISPIFPANYANSRRIACDAWNKIKDTEYTLNALSYGWWQDIVYNFNDADHVVLADATEGENRARVTSSVITGIFICGDDYSLSGDAEGKERSSRFLTNAAVNAVATGEAFRPVEGNGERSENMFISRRGDKLYLAVFNYGDDMQAYPINMARLGLDTGVEHSFKELWSGEEQTLPNGAEIEVSGKDAKLFEID
jgi:alpha-galactosidase